MDEIIEKILSSPALSLPPGGCQHLQYLIANMQIFTLEEYKQVAGIFFKLNPDSPLNQGNLAKNIESFMQEWIKIAGMVSHHNKKILLAWKRLHNDAIGADYNLPIILSQLPNNAIILKLLASKLESSTSIFTHGRLAYTLVELSAATEYKLRFTSFKKSNSCSSLFKHVRPALHQSKSTTNLPIYCGRPAKTLACLNEPEMDKYEITARIIKQDVKRMDLVTRYHSLLTIYKLYLENLDAEIYSKLSTESPDISAKYFCLKKEEMTQHIIDELRGNKLISDALNLLIEKRICMADFGYTLHLKGCPVEHVLTLFAKKFTHFTDIMEAQPNKFSVSFKSIHSYYMLPAYAVSMALPISTAETQFNAEAKKLCDYLNGAKAAEPSASSAAAAAAAVTVPRLQ